MDLRQLLEQLTHTLQTARRLPMSNWAMINEEEVFNIIDQMHQTIPHEIQKAHRIMEQKDKILADAHAEGARILQEKREAAETIIDNHQLVVDARTQAEAIRQQALAEATRLTSEADQYVLHRLQEMEASLGRALSQVQSGIQVMNESQHLQNATHPQPGMQPSSAAPADEHWYDESDISNMSENELEALASRIRENVYVK